MAEADVKQVAAMVAKVLADLEDKAAHKKVSAEVKELTSQFLVPGIDT